jgi:F-type H+-transporting ATPase subunit a
VVHFNWFQLVPGVGHEYIHVATTAFVTAFIVVLSVVGRFALGNGEAAIQPAGRFSLKGFFEVFVEFMVNLTNLVIGEHGRVWVPLFGSIFIFIWFNNLVGLLPGMTAPTDNFNTTLAVGLFSFVMYNYLGLKENGVHYLKHFLGPMLLLAPIMLPIEIISHMVRPVSLGLRLMGNMVGDHTVLGIFLDLVPVGIPAIFYGVGTFVSSMQAFVFTLLSMIYVLMATSHDH